MQAVGAEVRALIPESHVARETIAATIAREAGQYGTVIAATAIASGLGLFLAFAGLAGMMTLAAVQRTQEVAVRLALGAQRREIIGLFMWSLWRPLLRGLGIGLPVAALSATLLKRVNLLVDVKPTDPWPYGAAMVILIVTVCVATLIPALSAARAEPSRALRNE
jgi:ABC-type lipoprotein release transport system permease subunit